VVAIPVFLFTDIEGSTSLWAGHTTAMTAALERHDELLGGVIRRAGGEVFKNTGDGCCATFSSVAAAAEAAASAQRRLADAGWGELGKIRVRMAIHVGEAEPRGADWFGPALNRCARLMAIGHGGQILVSGAAHALLAQSLPAELGLLDLGVHRLRDLTQPERVWQLTGPGLEIQFPALRSLDSFRGRLPSQLSTFLGRDQELRELHDLMTSERIVTLVGTGGMGKTRLALQTATRGLDWFPDGAWFVELAPLSDSVALDHEVVATVGFRPQPSLTPRDLLTGGLREWRALLVLDNCEHLLEPVGEFVMDVLDRCPQVSVLATSRAPLRVPGERVRQVGPLSLDRDARALFVERASAARPGFSPEAANYDVVTAICQQLDGMPLAIELAAARLRSMTARELLDRLGQRFRLLKSDPGLHVGRHATLVGLVDWSFDLMSDSERSLLRDVGVFAGGFDVAAAHEVCVQDGSDELDTLNLLDALVEQSLLQVIELDGGTRYSMLETIRQYAVRRWTEAQGPALRRRHAAYFLDVAEAADSQLAGSDQVRWLRRLEAEHDNMRMALRWALSSGDDSQRALRLAAALSWFWRMHSHLAEGRHWIEEALAATAGCEAHDRAFLVVRARASNGAGLLAFAQSEFGAARRFFEAALELGRDAGEPSHAGWSLHGLGRVALEEADLPRASGLLEESIALFSVGDDWRGRAYSTFFLGAVLARQGDTVGAEARFETAKVPLCAAGDLWGLSALMAFSAAPALARGDLQEAARRYGESLGMYAELNSGWMASQALVGLAHTASLSERWEIAVRLYGAVDALADSFGIQARSTSKLVEDRAFLMLGLDTHGVHGRNLEAARLVLGGGTFDALWQEGRSLTLGQAINGGVAASEELAMQGGTGEPADNRSDGLTRRERDVLRLVADGRSNKEIATELVLSVRTVENHVAHIYAKLGVQSRVEAALFARGADRASPKT
jgi:predicted ATPase/class 3 adenylate cyclase/DNA-binding CsgD family transcriptional regulator